MSMRSQNSSKIHQGKLVARYRTYMKMSQQDLAEALSISIRTVQRMEKEAVIQDPGRRKFLVALLGIPAAYMLDSDEKQQELRTADVLFNDDPMSFIEDMVANCWKMLLMGGPLATAHGLDRTVKEIEIFTQKVSGKQWDQRAHAQLCMVYQLQGSVLGDMMHYEKARTLYQKAFTLANELHDAEMMAAVRVREGVIFMRKEQPQQAITHLTDAIHHIRGCGLHDLRGNALALLSEAYAKAKQPQDCWRTIDMSESVLQQRGNGRERSYRSFSSSFVAAHKGVDALLLHDYDRAIALIDKSLKIYNPTLTPERARLIARKAEAYYGKREIIEAASIATEALSLSYAVGASNTVTRIKELYTSLEQSQWKKVPDVVRLGVALSPP